MKQIDKIAREIKKKVCGKYYSTYVGATIYIDMKYDELYVKLWEVGEQRTYGSKNNIPIISYDCPKGNWCGWYGTKNKWHLTKRKIAKDIKYSLTDIFKDNVDEYLRLTPNWLIDEINFYIKKVSKI